MTGDAKVATHPQSMVGPAPAPQFQTLGRYTVIGELGRGGMGVVYLADDTVLKRKVALKIPQFEPDKAEQMQARFVREAQMAAQLSHINICQIYDVGVIDGQYVMAMEYIDGKTLSGFTKAGKLISERQAVYFVRKVAIAVEAAHQKGLIHRDLKPGNIMLPKADPVTKVIEPKVMDFGLAKSLEARTTELTKSGMIVGTPCYMSKEQWSGREAQLGPQCDIYSLGIILYELLTGKLPYDVDDEEPATAWFVKLVTQPQIRPTERKPDVDPALDAIVMRAIAKEAVDRYPSMAELAKDLDAWLKGKAKPAGQSLVGQLPLAPAPVNLLLDLGDIESIKSQPSLTMPPRRKPPGAIPTWALWAAGGAAAFLLGITFWFNFEKKPDGTVKATGGLTTTETPKETPLADRPAEQPDKDGWTPLFDGTDVSRWSTLGPFSVDDGQLVSTGARGNAISRNEYSDFELEAEWRVGKGGNSGIYYRKQSNGTNFVYAGNEYSIIDDDSYHPSVLTPDLRTGSLWGVLAPSISATKPVGEWNQTRIVCRGTTVEHWLNGGRIVRYDTASNEFRQAIAQSTIKAGKENIGSRQSGHFLLQSNGGEVAFRAVRIRELTADSTPAAVDTDSESAGPRTSTDDSDKELGITRLKEALVGYSWNYVDSLYLPGGPIRFYSNGKFHDQWKWNYWVVGPTTMHVQFWDANYSPSKSVVFTFNEDLTRFTAEFDKHKVTGTRLNAILGDSSATDPVTQLVGIQNGDFSDGLNGWQKEGNATDFKVYPLPSGGHYMTTHNGVYDARGRLYQTFDVPGDATRLEFFIHGGNSPSMYVALTENGKVLHRATGKNTNDWSPIAWDVSEFRGKQVTLEIVDQLVGRAWSHFGAYGFNIVRDTTVLDSLGEVPGSSADESMDENADSEDGYGIRGNSSKATMPGATIETEQAVSGGLNWLARHQNADGSWSFDGHSKHCKDASCTCEGTNPSKAGATAFALLPFLAAGQTHKKKGPYQKTINDGIKYMGRTAKPDGNLQAGVQSMYVQGVATMVLCEAYGMSKDPRLKAPAQKAVEYICRAQHPVLGGWHYYVPGGTLTPGDLSVTGWQLQALQSAELAGLDVPPQVLEKAVKFLMSVSKGTSGGLYSYMVASGPTPAMTSVGMLGMQFLGAKRTHSTMVEGMEYMMGNMPGKGARNSYYFYYATLSMHNYSGPKWDEWNRVTQKYLIETQEKVGCAGGSWSPELPTKDTWADDGGRLLITSLNTLTLEVYYRYPPLYQSSNNDAKEEPK